MLGPGRACARVCSGARATAGPASPCCQTAPSSTASSWCSRSLTAACRGGARVRARVSARTPSPPPCRTLPTRTSVLHDAPASAAFGKHNLRVDVRPGKKALHGGAVVVHVLDNDGGHGGALDAAGASAGALHSMHVVLRVSSPNVRAREPWRAAVQRPGLPSRRHQARAPRPRPLAPPSGERQRLVVRDHGVKHLAPARPACPVAFVCLRRAAGRTWSAPPAAPPRRRPRPQRPHRPSLARRASPPRVSASRALPFAPHTSPPRSRRTQRSARAPARLHMCAQCCGPRRTARSAPASACAPPSATSPSSASSQVRLR